LILSGAFPSTLLGMVSPFDKLRALSLSRGLSNHYPDLKIWVWRRRTYQLHQLRSFRICLNARLAETPFRSARISRFLMGRWIAFRSISSSSGLIDYSSLLFCHCHLSHSAWAQGKIITNPLPGRDRKSKHPLFRNGRMEPEGQVDQASKSLGFRILHSPKDFNHGKKLLSKK